MEKKMNPDQFAELSRRLDMIEQTVRALPDKAEIYKATLAIHAMVWATIATTLAITLASIRLFA